MPCYNPVKAYRATTVNPKTGKRGLVFKPQKGYTDLDLTVPCGGCIGCRLDKSRSWAIRCIHEAQLHDDNAYLTLTYSDENLPNDGSLKHDHFQKFMKSVRQKYGGEIRYFMCGEYSDAGRPHYHAIIFNIKITDKKVHTKNKQGDFIYTSEKLAKYWKHGFHYIGDVTFQSAAYVARYIMRKQTGEQGKDFYGNRKHPYLAMSRKNGIGKKWFDKYYKDLYPHDYVVINGKKMQVPKFYDQQYEKIEPEKMQKIKNQRLNFGKKLEKDSTIRRLRDRETVKTAQTETLTRN